MRNNKYDQAVSFLIDNLLPLFPQASLLFHMHESQNYDFILYDVSTSLHAFYITIYSQLCTA